MHKQVKHLGCSVLIALAIAEGASAQEDLPPRDQAYIANLIDLSAAIGGAHAIRVVCNGSDDQYWRLYMQQLLGLEAPVRGGLRSGMVDGFNSGYAQETSRRNRCDASAADAEALYAEEGARLSDALAAHYFPKRN